MYFLEVSIKNLNDNLKIKNSNIICFTCKDKFFHFYGSYSVVIKTWNFKRYNHKNFEIKKKLIKKSNEK